MKSEYGQGMAGFIAGLILAFLVLLVIITIAKPIVVRLWEELKNNALFGTIGCVLPLPLRAVLGQNRCSGKARNHLDLWV